MGAATRLDAARKRITERGGLDPLPLIALVQGVEYLCRAAHAKNPELGPIPDFPSREWAVETAKSLPDTPFTFAEIVVSEDVVNAGDAIAAIQSLGAQPTLDSVIF